MFNNLQVDVEILDDVTMHLDHLIFRCTMPFYKGSCFSFSIYSVHLCLALLLWECLCVYVRVVQYLCKFRHKHNMFIHINFRVWKW